MFERYRRYGADGDPRVRARVARAAEQLRGGYMAALWAMERYLRPTNAAVSARVRDLRVEMGREFGALSRLAAATLGAGLAVSARREASRFPTGRPLEPRTFLERTNWA
jgi:hypothetical protein